MKKNFWNNLKKPFFCLAPMADVTDPAFRRIIAKYGKPDVMYTEFVSADGLFRGGEPGEKGAGFDASVDALEFSDEERPIVAQFFSRSPELMTRGAELSVEMGFDGIDINMGCPDKNICKQGAGASLIKDPKLAREIIRATKKGAGSVPVSIKTRIGYSSTDEMDAWLRELLKEEPAALILHARTKKEMSKVPAHWEYIKRAVEIRNEVGSNTLIVGNGDVWDVENGKQKAEFSGCDGVMIGRGIFGNPWLFSGHKPTIEEKLTVLVEHTKLFEEILGEKRNFALMKKHYKAYVTGFVGAKELRIKLMGTDSAEQVEKVIRDFLGE